MTPAAQQRMGLRSAAAWLLGGSLLCSTLAAQNSPPQPAQAPPEMTTRETAATFQAGVREVLVRAVVRDAKGNAVSDLHRDDFEILDKSVPQKLTSFNLETAESRRVPPATQAAAAKGTPERYLAYLFDDLHFDVGELERVREAAGKHLDSALGPSDRAAIFTTSGQVMLDFTSDRAALRDAILRLTTRSLSPDRRVQCPWMSYYVANLILNKLDRDAQEAIVLDVMNCMGLTSMDRLQAEHIAVMTARQQWMEGVTQTRLVLTGLRDTINRLATAPGPRTMVTVSSGFLVLQDQLPELRAVIERALRANVAVNTLDARGVWNNPAFDATNSKSNGLLQRYMFDTARVQNESLAEVAEGTGGTFFHGNNDLGEGFARTATTPEFTYLLAFSPPGLKANGEFHPLTVKIRRPGRFTVTARRGYFAPSAQADAEQAAAADIEEAIFSRDEIQAIPLEVSTEFFKSSEENASLAVVAHVDVRPLSFRKEAGRHRNDLTVAYAIFDRNGRFVTGQQKVVEFHMHDEMLDKVLRSGIIVRTNFDVKPGGYMVRVVIRDTERQLLSARNGKVEIP